MKRARRVFMRRRDAMAGALRKHFPADARFDVPDGGLSMWVSLPHDCNTDDLLRLAVERGVQFLPGSAFYFRSPLHHSLRPRFPPQPDDPIQQAIPPLAPFPDTP